MHFRFWTAAALVACCALPAHAQQGGVKLQFNGGQVTLTAQNAPIRTILAEWARLGGVTIVNGDRVAGAPVTIELTGVPERQALDIVLRNVAGYMLAPRPAASTGVSAFDRIVILPTSVAPRNPPPGPAPNAAVAGARPVLPRPPTLVRPTEVPGDVAVDNESDDNGDQDPTPPLPPGLQTPFPPGAQRPPVPPGLVTRPPGTGPAGPVAGSGPAVPNTGGTVTFTSPDDEPETTTRTGTAPTPSNPFGIPPGSSATPGVVAPVPQQQQQQQQQNAPNRVQ